ncbi:MAG: hypothetical protein R3314_03110 [Longimicrobiales bacterium]|nr:hypothetical protein [Longimicrobiales bacterium]
MTDPLIERAIAVLHETPCVALPLTVLAARVGTTDPDGLALRIAGDPRLLLIEPPVFPGLALLPSTREEEYEAALRAAGLRTAPRVALTARPARTGGAAAPGGVAALLLETAARLMGPGPAADALAHAADRAYRAVTATAPPAAAPSTTRPPGPRPRPPAPPPRRPAGRPRPRRS